MDENAKIESMKREAHEAECSHEPAPRCEYCADTGIVEKTEWSGTDSSYEVEVKCQCQND